MSGQVSPRRPSRWWSGTNAFSALSGTRGVSSGANDKPRRRLLSRVGGATPAFWGAGTSGSRAVPSDPLLPALLTCRTPVPTGDRLEDDSDQGLTVAGECENGYQ